MEKFQPVGLDDAFKHSRPPLLSPDKLHQYVEWAAADTPADQVTSLAYAAWGMYLNATTQTAMNRNYTHWINAQRDKNGAAYLANQAKKK